MKQHTSQGHTRSVFPLQAFRCLLPLCIAVIGCSNTIHAQPWDTVGNGGFSAGQAVGYSKSIAIDGSGTPYVVYRDEGNSLKATVMKYSSGNWTAVGSAGFSPGEVNYTSLAIDGSGTPYVAFYDNSFFGKASVMKFSTIGWSYIGSGGFSPSDNANGTSIAIDWSGTPYVVYGGNNATVMKYNGTTWALVGSIDVSPNSAFYTSIAINSTGTPYIVYQDWSSSAKATVMRFDGTSWAVVGSAGFSAGEADYTTIAIDGSGTPYVAYRDYGNSNKATVMKYNGSSWVTVGIAGLSAGAVYSTSIAIDASGVPYVVYSDSSNGYKATVMKYNGVSWLTAANASFSAGQASNISIAINSSGVPYVVYTDVANGQKATVMNLLPIPPITGVDTLCIGATATLHDNMSGGVWSSSVPSVASVISTTGVVTAATDGMTTISYTLIGSSVTFPITVTSCTNEVKGVNIEPSVMLIYPNPNHGTFSLKISSGLSIAAQVTITDIFGQKIKEWITSTNKDTEVASELTPGVYFISAIGDDLSTNVKLMIE